MAGPSEVIRAYQMLKEQAEAIENDAAARVKPIKEQMTALNAWLQNYLLENKLQNVKTEAGTAYQKTSSKVKVIDPEMLLEWSEQNGIDFVPVDPDPALIKTYLDEGASRGVPPGVEVNSVISVQIRRA